MGLKLDNFLGNFAKHKIFSAKGSHRIARIGFFFSALLVCSWSTPAHADALPPYPPCTTAPSNSDVDAAMAAFQAGRISFEEGDYDRALLYWEDAFRRDCTAVKQLLNVARVYELKGDLRHTLLALETYLERSEESADAGVVEKRIAKLRERIAEEDAQRKATEPAPAAEKQAPPPPPPAPKSDRAARPLWPVFVTAGGVSVLAVGTTFAVLGQNAVSHEKDRISLEVVQLPDGSIVKDPSEDGQRCSRKGRKWSCPSTALQDAVSDELNDSSELKRSKTERTVGIVVASAGAVATGVGGYFWYRLWSSNAATDSAIVQLKPAILPVVMPGYQGLSVVGRF